MPMSFPSPSLTPPSLAAYQFQINGFTFGNNTAWGLLQIEGLDLAQIRMANQAWPRDHGEARGLDLYAGRDIIFDMWVKSDGVSLQDSQTQLAAATLAQPTGDSILWFQLPNLPLLAVSCRPAKKTLTIDADYATGGVMKPSLTLHATDPRIYTAGQQTQIGLGAVTAGLPFPVGPFPITFGVTTPNSQVITNSGNTESRPIIIFTGPLTNPSIGNASITGNPKLTLTNPNQGGGFTVASGDQLVVDMGVPYSVLYYVGGISSGLTPSPEIGWTVFGSSKWTLLPGNNTIQFLSSDSSNTGGTATVQYASAYML